MKVIETILNTPPPPPNPIIEKLIVRCHSLSTSDDDFLVIKVAREGTSHELRFHHQGQPYRGEVYLNDRELRELADKLYEIADQPKYPS